MVANSAIAGTDSSVRSSVRRSLARIARKALIATCPRVDRPRRRRPRAPSARPGVGDAAVGAQGEHPVGVGEAGLDLVGDDHPRPAPAPARAARRRPRPRRGRGASAARRAAAARARAAARGRSPPAAASRRRGCGPARRRGARARRARAARRSARSASLDAVQAGVELEVLAHGELAVEQRLVAEVADPPARLPGPRAAARRRAPRPRPPLGRSSVARIRSRVLLPAPLGPITTSVSPAASSSRDVAQHGALVVVAAQVAHGDGRRALTGIALGSRSELAVHRARIADPGARRVRIHSVWAKIAIAVALAATGLTEVERRAPATARVEWRDSVAVGEPGAGGLVRGVRLPAQGRHFFTWDPVLRRQPDRDWRRWGTDELVRTTLAGRCASSRAATRTRRGSGSAT